MPVIPNLATALADRPLLGTFVKLPRREVVELAKLTGLDFVICDYEHGQLDERDAAAVVLAGLACDLPVIARVPGLDSGLINRLLEAGAAGVQVPHVSSAKTAAAARAATRYPPDGIRSGSLAQPAAAYGTQPLADYLRESNERALCIGQLETAQYADALTDIVAALDVAFIGTFDLTLDCGVPGASSDPAVRSIVEKIENAAASTGTPLGMYASSADAATAAFRAGYRMVALDSDLGALARGFRDMTPVVPSAGS